MPRFFSMIYKLSQNKIPIKFNFQSRSAKNELFLSVSMISYNFLYFERVNWKSDGRRAGAAFDAWLDNLIIVDGIVRQLQLFFFAILKEKSDEIGVWIVDAIRRRKWNSQEIKSRSKHMSWPWTGCCALERRKSEKKRFCVSVKLEPKVLFVVQPTGIALNDSSHE